MPNTPLKILLLTPQTPFPPDQGAAIRNFSFVRYLGSDPRFELHLLSFARPGEDLQNSPARPELEKFCRQVVLVPPPAPRSRISRLRDLLLSRQPDLTRRLASPAFQSILVALLDEVRPDVIQCEGLEMVPFVQSIAPDRPVKLILDEHNAEYVLQRRIFEQDWQAGWLHRPAALYSLIQSVRLQRYEKKVLQTFQPVAVSQPDRVALQRLKPASHLFPVIPNCLDLQEFSFEEEDASVEPDRLVFTGTMDFRPNVDAVNWFAREVWPLIRTRKPAARFTIVGRRPAPAVLALDGQAGIEVVGEVKDARPYIRRSLLYVVPMRMGGGVRFKVLEALALGKAVVTTSMGADGIELKPGEQAMLADSPVTFAGAVLDLLDDPVRRRALAVAGRAFVETNFDWRRVTPALDQVLFDRD